MKIEREREREKEREKRERGRLGMKNRFEQAGQERESWNGIRIRSSPSFSPCLRLFLSMLVSLSLHACVFDSVLSGVLCPREKS